MKNLEVLLISDEDTLVGVKVNEKEYFIKPGLGYNEIINDIEETEKVVFLPFLSYGKSERISLEDYQNQREGKLYYNLGLGTCYSTFDYPFKGTYTLPNIKNKVKGLITHLDTSFPIYAKEENGKMIDLLTGIIIPYDDTNQYTLPKVKGISFNSKYVCTEEEVYDNIKNLTLKEKKRYKRELLKANENMEKYYDALKEKTDKIMICNNLKKLIRK